MKNLMTAPEIDYWRDHLKRILMQDFNRLPEYDEETLRYIDLIFEEVKNLKPNADGVKNLWIKANRGTLKDFDDNCPYGEAESEEELMRWRDEAYPEETEWYLFGCYADEKDNYKAISIEHCRVLTICDWREKSHSEDLSEFARWIYESVKSTMEMLRNGAYNDDVQQNLPVHHRKGYISRKDLWDIYEAEREEFFKNLPPEEVAEIVSLIDVQTANTTFEKRAKSMTANDFYRLCALGYAENKYHGTELTPKEQYYLHADGRDDDLQDIDGDDPDAFYHWLHDRSRGGHPWEVCRGGNSTHVSLTVCNDKDGYYLYLDGNAWNRTVETLKFFLALSRIGAPVYLDDALELQARILQTEKVGILPRGVMPRYQDSAFPEKDHIIDYYNLPYEECHAVAAKCVWYDEPKAELLSNEGDIS